jgi:hypothetical protein
MIEVGITFLSSKIKELSNHVLEDIDSNVFFFSFFNYLIGRVCSERAKDSGHMNGTGTEYEY